MLLEQEQLSQVSEEKNTLLLNQLIKTIALTPPEDFFDALVKGISEALQVPYVLISEFLAEEHKIAVISSYSHGIQNRTLSNLCWKRIACLREL